MMIYNEALDALRGCVIFSCYYKVKENFSGTGLGNTDKMLLILSFVD